MREWLSGGVSPCQGEGRGFESRLALLKIGRVFFRFFVAKNKFTDSFPFNFYKKIPASLKNIS